MSAVLLAVFNDYEAASRVRTALVRDGLPTDRVELTAVCEPGRAALQPAESSHDRFMQYYRTLFKSDDDFPYIEALTERIDCGAATVYALGQGLDIRKVVVGFEEGSVVLHEPVVGRLSRLQ